MQLNYASIIEQIANCIELALPIGIVIGLVERVINMVLDAALDRHGRRERL